MNPLVPQEEIDAALESDRIRNRAEYLGEWRSDVEGFVTRAAVEACIDYGIRERPPLQGIRYSAFVDLAGGGPDSFALAVAHRADDGRIVLDCLREVPGPNLNPSVVIEEFSGVLRSYWISSVRGDNYAKEWPVEQFARHGITYQAAGKFKNDIYIATLPLINSAQVSLLDHTKMVNQLLDLDRVSARGGRESVDHPKGSHDDLCNAACGALLFAASPTRTLASVGCQDGSVLYRDANGAWARRWPRQEREPLRIRTIRVAEADMEAHKIQLAKPLFQPTKRARRRGTAR